MRRRLAIGGFGDALGQVFGFGYPTYGFTLTLNLPIKNRSAEADLGSGLVSRRRDLYLQRQLQQAVTLEVRIPKSALKVQLLGIEDAPLPEAPLESAEVAVAGGLGFTKEEFALVQQQLL